MIRHMPMLHIVACHVLNMLDAAHESAPESVEPTTVRLVRRGLAERTLRALDARNDESAPQTQRSPISSVRVVSRPVVVMTA